MSEKIWSALEETWRIVKSPCLSCDKLDICDPATQREQIARCIDTPKGVPEPTTIYCFEKSDAAWSTHEVAREQEAEMVFFPLLLKIISEQDNCEINPEFFLAAVEMVYGARDSDAALLQRISVLLDPEYRRFVDEFLAEGRRAQDEFRTTLFSNMAVMADGAINVVEQYSGQE